MYGSRKADVCYRELDMKLRQIENVLGLGLKTYKFRTKSETRVTVGELGERRTR